MIKLKGIWTLVSSWEHLDKIAKKVSKLCSMKYLIRPSVSHRTYPPPTHPLFTVLTVKGRRPVSGGFFTKGWIAYLLLNNNNNNLFSLYDLQFVIILYSVCDASGYRLQSRVGIPTDHLGSICRGSWLTVDLKIIHKINKVVTTEKRNFLN